MSSEIMDIYMDGWDSDKHSFTIEEKCPKCGKALRHLTRLKTNMCENPHCTYSKKTCGRVF